MNAVLAVLSFLVALGLSLALLAFAVVTLGFSGESHRSGMTPLHVALNIVALVIAFAPLVITLWVAWRRFVSSRPWDDVPLGTGLPLVACAVCAGATFLSFLAGEWVASLDSNRKRAQELAALRAEVEGGAQEKACDLVLLDPMATPADMQRCRARIESLSDPRARWAELRKFRHDISGFNGWTPMKVGLAPEWDWNREVVAVRHDQEWFIRAFYETWLAQPAAFQSPEELQHLQGCLRVSTRGHGWTPAALDVLRSQVLPELVGRLESPQDPPRDPHVEGRIQELIKSLQESPGGGGPPTPRLDAVPEGTIGLAKLDDEGNLHLWLRATPTTGAFGDVYFTYDPSDEHLRHWKGHLGSMEPGEVRPVEPLTE
ncbi:hypothetical protein ACLESD_41500 [Pyxidicoccus sp. 3LFB2]